MAKPEDLKIVESVEPDAFSPVVLVPEVVAPAFVATSVSATNLTSTEFLVAEARRLIALADTDEALHGEAAQACVLVCNVFSAINRDPAEFTSAIQRFLKLP